MGGVWVRSGEDVGAAEVGWGTVGPEVEELGEEGCDLEYDGAASEAGLTGAFDGGFLCRTFVF